MRDAEATKARLLGAAGAEFAAYGIAGARVDRIAENAGASKAMLYAYFGNKDALFDAVFADRVGANVGAVSFDAHDIPGYVTALYDAYLDDPTLLRLVTWNRLERCPTGPQFGSIGGDDTPNLARIADAQRDGVVVADVAPAELWAMIIALAGTWAQAAVVHAGERTERPAVHRRRKRALAAAAGRAFTTQD